MPIELIRKSQQIAPRSGGTTTQLFIYSWNETYSNLQFDFRISTATVEVETSIFTQLPGVRRTLMVLDGTMELHHQHHHTNNFKIWCGWIYGRLAHKFHRKCTIQTHVPRKCNRSNVWTFLSIQHHQTCTIPPNSMNFYCVSGELTISIHSSAADTNNFTETIPLTIFW